MRRDGLISYHLIGVHPDKSVFIQGLNDSVPENLTSMDILAFKSLCAKAGTRICCTIRCRQEGDELTYYHSFFSEPSPEDEEVKNTALLRIVADGTLSPNNPRAAENLIADVELAQSLEINMNREQQ